MERREEDIEVPQGTENAPGFRDRARELEPEVDDVKPLEGIAAARYEAATGATLSRPDPEDPSHDFVDQTSKERIEFKGPLPEVRGEISDQMVEGLIDATLEEANLQTGADRIVVDKTGLSHEQLDRVREALDNGDASEIPLQIMR